MAQLDSVLDTDDVMSSDNDECGVSDTLDSFFDTETLIASQGVAMGDALGGCPDTAGVLASFSTPKCCDCVANECGTLSGCQDQIYMHSPDFTLVDILHLTWAVNTDCNYGYHCHGGSQGWYNCSHIGDCGEWCCTTGCKWNQCSGSSENDCENITDSGVCDYMYGSGLPPWCGPWTMCVYNDPDCTGDSGTICSQHYGDQSACENQGYCPGSSGCGETDDCENAICSTCEYYGFATGSGGCGGTAGPWLCWDLGESVCGCVSICGSWGEVITNADAQCWFDQAASFAWWVKYPVCGANPDEFSYSEYKKTIGNVGTTGCGNCPYGLYDNLTTTIQTS